MNNDAPQRPLATSAPISYLEFTTLKHVPKQRPKLNLSAIDSAEDFAEAFVHTSNFCGDYVEVDTQLLLKFLRMHFRQF
jgi:hypothetical protein